MRLRGDVRKKLEEDFEKALQENPELAKTLGKPVGVATSGLDMSFNYNHDQPSWNSKNYDSFSA
jgi:hypothetical protein